MYTAFIIITDISRGKKKKTHTHTHTYKTHTKKKKSFLPHTHSKQPLKSYFSHSSIRATLVLLIRQKSVHEQKGDIDFKNLLVRHSEPAGMSKLQPAFWCFCLRLVLTDMLGALWSVLWHLLTVLDAKLSRPLWAARCLMVSVHLMPQGVRKIRAQL